MHWSAFVVDLKSLLLKGAAGACFIAGVVHAADSDLDVQRLQQLRDQQQIELRLKMQQHQDRALHPAPTPSAEQQRLYADRDQQQRQRELHEQQSRELSVPGAPTDLAGTRSLERDRAAEQARRSDLERR